MQCKMCNYDKIVYGKTMLVAFVVYLYIIIYICSYVHVYYKHLITLCNYTILSTVHTYAYTYIYIQSRVYNG